MTIYRQVSDGWFTYYYCGVCGNKALNRPKICPKCGAPMTVRRSRFGKLFYGCTKYPKCNVIVNLD